MLMKSCLQLLLGSRFVFFALRFNFFMSLLKTVYPFTPNSAKSKIDKFSKITNWVKLKNKQHHSKELLNSFAMNGPALGNNNHFIRSRGSLVAKLQRGPDSAIQRKIYNKYFYVISM